MSSRRSLRSPAFLRSASPFVGRSASAPFARSASPFVRLEKAGLGRLSEHQSRQEDIYSLGLPPALEDVGSEADTLSDRPSFASPARSTVASFASPRSTEYCCAICIELLLRPVVLSRAVTASAAAAGYAYCRAARRAPSLAAPATPSARSAVAR